MNATTAVMSTETENELLVNVKELEVLPLGTNKNFSDDLIVAHFRALAVAYNLGDYFLPPMWEKFQGMLQSYRRQGLLVLMGAVYSNYAIAGTRMGIGDDQAYKGRTAIRIKTMIKKVLHFVDTYGTLRNKNAKKKRKRKEAR